jgi:hypothetical protein
MGEDQEREVVQAKESGYRPALFLGDLKQLHDANKSFAEQTDF